MKFSVNTINVSTKILAERYFDFIYFKTKRRLIEFIQNSLNTYIFFRNRVFIYIFRNKI